MLIVTPTEIEDVKLIVPKAFNDSHGSFCETYNRQRFFDVGIELDFVQDNQSLSRQVGTIRGLHYQSPPMAQDKLVRVLHGSILDVAVDLRRSSATYGRWVAEEMSARNAKQLLVPIGFAHGFCTLEPDTIVLYKVTNYYSPSNDCGIAWDDPDIGISWPLPASGAVLSDKDSRLQRFGAVQSCFE